MTAARPPALRVPVTDVVTRASLVTPLPPPRGGGSDLPPALAVVQRPVRIISDPPPPPPSMPPEPTPSSEPTVTIESATPPDGHLSELEQAYSALEVEPLDSLDHLELSDELSEAEAADAAGPEEDEPDSEIEVSLPPPAPPEALRRSSPAEENRGLDEASLAEELEGPDETLHDSEALQDDMDDDEEPRRPSGEFEELMEVEPEERTDPGEATRQPAPPPPPQQGGISDLPDLAALTRAARIQELRPSRPRAHAWWEVFFDDDYLRTVRPPTREQIARQCDFIEKRVGVPPGGTLLDVGCGLGLQVLELASRGYMGVGLDL
jgi:hypothetical protein